MEGSSGYSMSGGHQGQPPIPQQEIHESFVPQDAAARRWTGRAANRNYSRKYRNKQLSHVMKIEEQERKLKESIAENSLKLEFCKEAKSDLLVEVEALEETAYEFSAQSHVAEVVAAELRAEKQHLELIDQVNNLRLKYC